MTWFNEAGQLIVTAGGTAALLRIVGFRFRKEKEKEKQPPRPVCGCEHDFAFHDLRTGECHDTVEVPTKYDQFGVARAWRQEPCTCRHYTGPIPGELEFRPPPLMPREDT